jgi:hypothetical protein
MGPSQPNRMLCSGIAPRVGNNPTNHYFFTKEQDYEYSSMEVKEEVRDND